MKKNGLKLFSILLTMILLISITGCQQGTRTPSNSEGPGNVSTSGTEDPEKEAINEMTGLKKDPTILFMGDSITDGGRTDYSVKTFLGANHPKAVANYLRRTFRDEEFTIYSTGVSGDTVLDQYFRLQEDCFDLDPDYIIMMLGVNDSWNAYKGRDAFEKGYRYLLDEMIANTDAQIILVQPYLLQADQAMQNLCVIPNVNNYIPTVKEIADVVCTLAAEYKLDIIYLAEILEQQHKKGTSYMELAPDAIHPTALNSAILADQILLAMGVKDYVPAYGVFDTSEIAAKYNK